MRLHPLDWRRSADPIPVPTRINLGPLTTVFVPPPYCTRAAVAVQGSQGQGVLGQSCRPVDDKTATPADDTGCWPRATSYPAAAVASSASSSLGAMGFYSPGLLCPTGYVSACTAVSTAKGGKGGKGGKTGVPAAPQVTGKFQFPLVEGETAVGCCPAGYTCGAHGGYQACHQVATETSFDAMTCGGLEGRNLDAFQVPGTLAGETIATMDLWAPMIQINHMATDLPATTTTTSENLPVSTETAEASRSGAKSSGDAEVSATETEAASETATATAGAELVKMANVTSGEASTSTKASRTKSSAKAEATGSDEVVRVKGVQSEDSSTAEETSSKASKTSSPSTTKAPSAAAPTPTIDWSNSAVAAGEPGGLLVDTRLPPSVSQTLWPSPPISTTAAASNASPSEQPAPANSFSTGAKVGVACAPIAGAALILLGIFYYKRRKQNTGTYKDDAKSISSYQSTYFGGAGSSASTIQVHESGTARRLTVDAYSTPTPLSRAHSPYIEDDRASQSTAMAMNGPGPAVVAPAAYAHSPVIAPAPNNLSAADFYANPWTDKDEFEYETRPGTHALRFKDSLSTSSVDLDSPIDGASPFRLKRKSTLRGREAAKRLSAPAAADARHVSMMGSIEHHDDAHRASHGSSDGEFDTMKRSNSFSKPRTRVERPLTTASSVYPADRDSVMSWDAAMAPDMPDKPLPSIPEKGVGVGGEWRAGVYPMGEEEKEKEKGTGASPGLDRSKSFSRPRPKREVSPEPEALAVVQVEGEGRAATPVPKGVVAPPVTAEGVSF